MAQKYFMFKEYMRFVGCGGELSIKTWIVNRLIRQLLQ